VSIKLSRIVWSAIIVQAKSDLVGTFSVLRRIVGDSLSAAVPLALYSSLIPRPSLKAWV